MYTDKRLNRTDLVVLGLICAHINRSSGRAWPSFTRLAKLASVDAKHVRAAIKRLEGFGYIEVERRRRGDGQWSTNTYRLQGGVGAECAPTWGQNVPLGVGAESAPLTFKTRTPEENSSAVTAGAFARAARLDHAFLRELEQRLDSGAVDASQVEELALEVQNQAVEAGDHSLQQHAWRVQEKAGEAIAENGPNA
jgi:hypothetical protein